MIHYLTPRDVLFVGDGRPMEAGQGTGGHGGRWPTPDVTFHALHSALHLQATDKEKADQGHHHRGHYFSNLVTAGPWPVVETATTKQWFFATPSNLAPSDVPQHDRALPMSEELGQSDLSSTFPWLQPLGSTVRPSKAKLPTWCTKLELETYLRGAPLPQHAGRTDADLFSKDWTTGIGIDRSTNTQDGKNIYSAEYLRLRDDGQGRTSMGLLISGGPQRDNRADYPRQLILGGQSGLASLRPEEGNPTTLLPTSQWSYEKHSGCVTWLLLSPAVFPSIPAVRIRYRPPDKKPKTDHPGGWLPTWINHYTGKVLLPAERPSGKRTEEFVIGKGTKVRRAHQDTVFIDAQLISASVPKPQILARYSKQEHRSGKPGAQPTQLAVPAGAVYFFKAETEADAQALVHALSWHGSSTSNPNKITRRSSLLGEQGFGLGVCGGWKSYEDAMKS